MQITTETIITFIAVAGSVLSIILNTMKVKHDSAKKIKEDTEWKANVSFQLKTIGENSIELKINHQKFTEDLAKNNSQTEQNTKEIANLKDAQKRILDKIDVLSNSK